jgi:hypothetical protein
MFGVVSGLGSVEVRRYVFVYLLLPWCHNASGSSQGTYMMAYRHGQYLAYRRSSYTYWRAFTVAQHYRWVSYNITHKTHLLQHLRKRRN